MTAPTRIHTRAAIVIALALVVIYAEIGALRFAMQDDVHRLLVRVADDASYYLTTARNIAAGRGITFDGLHPTNGFHPLWLMLLVPLFWLQAAPEFMLRVVVELQALLLGIACLVLARTQARLFSPQTALLGAILFIPLIFVPNINGMESALLMLLLVALYAYGQRVWQLPVAFPRALGLGALLGLVLLARLDLAFLCVPLLVLTLRALADRRTRRAAMLAGSGAAAGCAAVLAPYLIFNLVVFGSILPISAALKSSFPAPALSPGTVGAVARSDYVYVVVAVLCLLRALVGRVRSSFDFGAGYYRVSTIMLAWTVLLHFAYTMVFMRWGVFRWYFSFYALLAVIVFPGVMEWIMRSMVWPRSARVYWIGVIAFSGIAAWRQASIDFFPRHGGWHTPVYDAALWARAHTAPGAIFAMSDCGHFAFFSERRVINLDGLVNDFDYQRTLAERRLNQYLDENRVDYLVQHAIHSREDVINGTYQELELRYKSERYQVLSDAIVMHRRDEAYRSALFLDGDYPSVLVIWSLDDGARSTTEKASLSGRRQ